MTDKRQSSAVGRYVVTAFGHQALREQASCRCELRWQGLVLECPLCGTVYTVYGAPARDGRADR